MIQFILNDFFLAIEMKKQFSALILVLAFILGSVNFVSCDKKNDDFQQNEHTDAADMIQTGDEIKTEVNAPNEEEAQTNMQEDMLEDECLHYVLINDGSAYAVYGIGTVTSKDIVIPSNHNGLPVVSILNNAFEYENITSIIIPDSVTSIGPQAFYECRELVSIEIPDSVTKIGNIAFERCFSLVAIEIPNSVTTIGHYVFSQCHSLSSVKLPDNLTAIPDGMFYQCDKLRDIVIPDSVTSIGAYSFENTSLESINIPLNATYIGRGAFMGCSNLTNFTIPDGVTEIGDGTFSYCSKLKDIEIPIGVKSIGEAAFAYCIELKNIYIPNGLNNIGCRCFEECTKLETIYFGGTQDEWNSLTGNVDLGVDSENFALNILDNVN